MMMRKCLLILLFTLATFTTFAQYCYPAYQQYNITAGALKVCAISGFAGTAINDTLPVTSLASGYANRTAAVAVLRLQQGKTYAGMLTYHASAQYTGNQIWIDFNNDNTFADTEIVSQVFPAAFSGYFSNPTFTLNIPVGATPGNHRMRVRNVRYNITTSPGYAFTTLDACGGFDSLNDYANGVTADYVVNIALLTGCAGMPEAGEVTGIVAACLGTSINLALANDTVAGGLRYQWYSKPVGAGIMSAIAGATTRQYRLPVFSTPTEFQVVATCPASSAFDSSRIHTVNLNAPTECYCTTEPGGNLERATIDSIGIAGTRLGLVSRGAGIYASYSDTGRATATLMAGNSYALYVKSGGYNRFHAYAWVDNDNNGVFDTSEYVVLGTSVTAGSIAAGVIVLPTASDTGLTRVRIRTTTDSFGLNSADACRFETTGQTRDLTIRIIAATPCGGAPPPATLSPSLTGACTGTPFTIVATGYELTTNYTLQWMSRPASGGMFNDIAGANSILLRVPSQLAATEYRLRATCTATSLSDTASGVTVNQNPYFLCYCSPINNVTLNRFADVASPDSVSITGTSLQHFAGTGALYARYFPTTTATTTTLSRAGSYAITVKSNRVNNYNAYMWIDYNHNSSFEAGEYTAIGTNIAAGTAATATFAVPETADTSLTAIRIRTGLYSSLLTGTGACTEVPYGSTADYVVRIDSGTRCSGRPSAGRSISSVTTVCAGEAFRVTDTAFTNGRGIVYQWIYSAASGTTYTAITGETAVSMRVSSQPIARDYRLVATCTFSGLSDTSTRVSVGMKAIYQCNCSPTTGTAINDSNYQATLDSFSMAPGTLNDYSPTDTNSYLLRFPVSSATTTNLQRSGGYVVAIKSTGTMPWKAAIWLDYNQNGTFETSEYTAVTAATLSGAVALGAIHIPATAATGNTSLRVRIGLASDAMGANDACTRYVYGTTRDYMVTIASSTTCTGTPSAGSVAGPAMGVCAGTPFSLNAVGYSIGTGITYQWLRLSVDSGVTSLISGATSPTYTAPALPSYSGYSLIVTCAASGLRDTSSLLNVDYAPSYFCYCSPTTGTTLSSIGWRAPIDTFAIAGTTLANYTPGNDSPYIRYYPATSTTTADLLQGRSYNVKVNANGPGTYNAAVWIDQNRNGIYEPAEYQSLGAGIGAGRTATSSYAISAFADTGYTGMRVRTSSGRFTFGSADACTNLAEGATRDYVVHLLPGTPCSGTPATTRAFAPSNTTCPSVPFTLVDTGFTVDVGITYQWQSRPLGTSIFTNIAGATATSYFVSAQPTSTEYQMVTRCTGSGLASSSNVVQVRTLPFYACYCGTPLGTSAATTQINRVQVPGTTLNIRGAFTNTYKSFAIIGDSTGTLQRSLSYTLNMQVSGGATYNAAMWIDYNRDAIFQSTEYIFLDTGVATGSTLSPIFTLPATADTGITGMRIRVTPSTLSAGDACTFIANSQTFDIKVKIDTLVNCTGRPNAGAITSTSPFACPAMTFQLTDTGYDVGGGISYQWYRRTTGAYAAISGATSYTYTVRGQTVTTQYILVARCSFSGLTDTTNVLNITENPFDSCYCSPPTGVSLVAAGGDSIILIAAITGTTLYSPTQTPGATGYVAVPPTLSYNTATMTRSSSYPVVLYVNYSRFTVSDAGVWVDYDHSSTFDSSEFVRLTQSADRSNWSGNINIPVTSLLGNTGIRFVTTKTGSISPSGSCTRIASGQVQDHIITITRPPCYSISTIRATGVTDSSARVSWSPVSTSVGYQFIINTTSSSPTVSGTPTTDTFVNMRCLTSNTNYYMHVRDSCGVGDLSGWITIGFTTSVCRATDTPTITAITNTTATASWGAIGGSTGYEYVLDTTASLPTGSGTATSATSINFTGLTQGTTYYVHVRSGCRCTNRSVWETVSFTTVCDTVANLTVYGILDTAAFIRWDSIRGISRYEYVVNTTASDPTGAGIALTDSSRRVNGLTPGTTYYAHVRHVCFGGFSDWKTVAFSTSRCDTITSIAAYPSDTSVRVTWTAVSGGTSYFYVINTSPLDPAGTGIPTSSTTVIQGGLSTSTNYYVHIRTSCAGGVARWQTILFRTLACDTVNTILVTGICDTNADISWSYGAAGAGFLYVVNTSSASPTVRGTYTNIPSLTINTLAPGTTYYVHVRKLCGTTDTSAWVTSAPFTTQPCDPVTGLTVTAITGTTAAVNWTFLSCVRGYEYVVDNSAADPTVAGIYTPLNYVNLSSLTPGMSYFVHVRVSCGRGFYSNWISIPFFTLCEATTISVGSISDNSATVNWAPFAGAAGYEYAVDNSPTPPASGTTTTATSYVASSLLSNSLYYAHVRVLCVGSQSVWADTPFTTYNVGVEQLAQNAFPVRVYPNPANEQVTVGFQQLPNNGYITLTDITGKILLRTGVDNLSMQVDLSGLASGTYLLKYTDDTHNQVYKLHKQ